MDSGQAGPGNRPGDHRDPAQGRPNLSFEYWLLTV